MMRKVDLASKDFINKSRSSAPRSSEANVEISMSQV